MHEGYPYPCCTSVSFATVLRLVSSFHLFPQGSYGTDRDVHGFVLMPTVSVLKSTHGFPIAPNSDEGSKYGTVAHEYNLMFMGNVIHPTMDRQLVSNS
jgi:hypothetical protein